MNNKIITSVLIIFFVLATTSYAKEGQVTVNDFIVKMRSELDLTDQQVEAVRPIIKKYTAKRQDLFKSIQEEAVVNKTSIKKALRKLNDEENQDLSTVLSADQMKKRIHRQHLQESLNKDQIDFSEGLNFGVNLNPSGASMQF